MCKHKQASESSLGAEVDNQSPLAIYTHAGRVQCTYENSDSHTNAASPSQTWIFFFVRISLLVSGCPTLQVGLRWAADAVPP